MAYSVFDNPYYLQTSAKPQQQIVESPAQQSLMGSTNVNQQTKTPGQSQMDFSSVLSGVGAGVGAAAANSANPDRFSVDPNAGLTGSTEGLMSGGWIGAIVGGVGSQLGQFSNVNKSIAAVDPNVNAFTTDSSGRPVYQSGNVVQARQTMGDLQRGEDSMTQSLFEGGEGIDPATILFGALYGSPEKASKKRRQIRASIDAQQNRFNRQNLLYNQQLQARKAYEDQLKNVYSVPLTYY